MTDMTAFKEWLLEEMRQAFDHEFEWEDGRLDAVSPSEDRTIGCVWTIGYQEVGENVAQAEFVHGIRIYRQAHVPADPYTVLSTTPLEQDIMTVCKRLEVDQSGDGSMWYFRVTQAEIDPDVYGTEYRITSRGDNPFDP